MRFSWPTLCRTAYWCLLLGLASAVSAWSAAEQKPQVVTGKITLPTELAGAPEAGKPSAEVKQEAAAVSGEEARPGGAAGPQPQVVRQKITLPGAETAPAPVPMPVPAPMPQAATPAPAAGTETAAPAAPAPAADLQSPLGIEKEPLKTTYSYNPEGKIDPFEPLFRAKPKVEEKKEKKTRPKRVPRTPLEMVDISQLKLSAVITAPSGNRALVEEASGKGYVIREGTPIGIHWGKVAEIQIDRVIVEEEVEDLMGNYVKRNREMKLNKPIGE
jgi:type IV pilus assembly protein PilP